MRLFLDNDWRHCGICNDKDVIETLNLHNSLKNLTLYMIWTSKLFNDREKQFKISNILEKKHYYNLENVNIIVEMRDKRAFGRIFHTSKENTTILKNQFKQLNIALITNINNRLSVLAFEWNEKMDDKRLDQLQKHVNNIKKMFLNVNTMVGSVFSW